MDIVTPVDATMEKHTELANVTCNCSLYMKCNCAKREGN
jgi:hypothetical protein